MNTCYLSLGSNQKVPLRQLRRAIKSIKALPKSQVVQISKMYWNKAWGMTAQQDFCNLILKMNTIIQPEDLLRLCQKIEKNQGRIRKKKWGPRVLDIDIILYGSIKLNKPHLTIPHKHYQNRDFVLIPLAELTSGAVRIRT